MQQNGNWQSKVIEKLLLSAHKEQKRARRWNILFRLCFFGYLFFMTFYIVYGGGKINSELLKQASPHAALIKIDGTIMSNEMTNADNVFASLKRSSQNKQVKGIILDINSPGGSAVQSRRIFNEINRIRNLHPATPIYAVIEDIGTSAAYLIATATDEIYCDKSSIIGSIGVLFNLFGAVDAMNHLGIERRLITAGEHKGMIDPFSPFTEESKEMLQEQVNIIHQQFISNVSDKRGAKIRKDNQELYSGRFWTGEQARLLGLVDGFGDAQFVARELLKVEDIVDYTVTNNLLSKFKQSIGTILTRLSNFGTPQFML